MDVASTTETSRDPRFLHAQLETMPREQLAALQLRRLRDTLENAYANVPPVRRKLDEAGVRPGDVRRLEDVALLPFTKKTDLRDNYPFGLFAVPDGADRPHARLSRAPPASPPSSATPGRTSTSWADLMARSFCAAGVRPSDIVQNAYGYGLFTGGLGAHYGAERLGATVIPISGGNTERQIMLIQDFGATRALLHPLLCALPRRGRRASRASTCARATLRVGIFGAEPWTEAMRRRSSSASGIRAFDIYGLSEIIGPGVSCECERRRRAARLRGPLPVRRSSTRRPASRCPTAGRRTGLHHAHQGGAAPDPLPHPRHHAAAPPSRAPAAAPMRAWPAHQPAAPTTC